MYLLTLKAVLIFFAYVLLQSLPSSHIIISFSGDLQYSPLILMIRLSSRITYVQSGPGVTTVQQATAAPGPAYLPPSLATLGFTAIAPAGQTLVQPMAGQPPLLAQAPPLSCQSQTPPGQASGAAGRQVKSSRELHSVSTRESLCSADCSECVVCWWCQNKHLRSEKLNIVYLFISRDFASSLHF